MKLKIITLLVLLMLLSGCSGKNPEPMIPETSLVITETIAEPGVATEITEKLTKITEASPAISETADLKNAMIETCINDFKERFGNEILDIALYDIDQDNENELFILNPSTYLLSNELHCYKINGGHYVDCGSILVQCKINYNITDESSPLYSYDSIDLCKCTKGKDASYLLCSSFRSVYDRNSQIVALSMKDNILQDQLMYEWGVYVNQTLSGEEYIPYFYIYDGEEKGESTEKDFYERLKNL